MPPRIDSGRVIYSSSRSSTSHFAKGSIDVSGTHTVHSQILGLGWSPHSFKTVRCSCPLALASTLHPPFGAGEHDVPALWRWRARCSCPLSTRVISEERKRREERESTVLLSIAQSTAQYCTALFSLLHSTVRYTARYCEVYCTVL